jgi:alpha-tubulin suppressor-like RCC1 family protein
MQLGNDFPFGEPGLTAEDYKSVIPVRVAGSQRFARISAGLEHTCAVTATGRGYCWGNNLAGRLGTGETDFFPGTQVPVHTVPALVLDP